MPRVLIVDDAAFMRSMIKDILVKNGFEVVGEAGNGNEAVRMVGELKPDLITMDIVMPMKSGIEATREILGLYPDARVVICSALGQESLVMEAMEVGAKDFIVKPFKEDQVLATCRKFAAEQS
jgi:two-component system, chemotaxis family, chemotaxis protein CheY